MWAILALALFLRGLRLDDVIGGFHDHNEATYTLMAAHFTPATLLFPNPDGRLFLETPPLYAWLLAVLFRFTGVSVFAARLFTIATGLGLVVATYLLGRRLASERAGVAAALLVAVAPVAVLTGRNIQTDTPLAFLSVTAVLLYARAQSEEGTRGDAVAFGVALGLAAFTKLFAIVLVPALVAWELAVRRAAPRGRRLRTLAVGLPVAAILPLLFYGFHFARDFPGARALVFGGAASAQGLPASASAWAGLLIEAVWAFSPPVTLCVAAGVAVALVRRTPPLLLALFLFGAHAAFFAVVHKHSYYVLTLLPWGAILAGAAFAGIPPDAVRRTILGVAAAGAVFVTLVDLTAMKLGFDEFAEFGRESKAIPDASYPLLVSQDMVDSHGTVLNFYDPRARLVAMQTLRRGPDGRLTLPEAASRPYLLTFVPPQTRSAAGGALLERERYGVEVFGRTLAEAHPNAHYFRQGRYFVEKTGGPLEFGIQPLRSYPALALVPIPPGLGLWATPSGITVRPAPPGAP
jgi:4-amino-4-deoxy-L-arabinose transferase-like glycosyltransferase